MRRHLDDHPSLNSSSSGVFNSNSLPLSAANSANSNSRTFPDLDGAFNSNIPLTTSSTSTPGFHSSRTFAPISPDNNNKSSIPRRPFAMFQKTVHAVGTSSNSEMPSGVQSRYNISPDNSNKSLIPRRLFPMFQQTVHAVGTSSNSEMQSGVQSRYNFRPRVAAATTSQGGLGHSQSSSGVHHTLPGQAQAHSNTQVVHPIVQTNSQVHVATQMQGNWFQELEPDKQQDYEDAVSYVNQVKNKFRNQSEVYIDFLKLVHEIKSRNFDVDTQEVIQRVSNLFRGHPELIDGFMAYFQPDYRNEVQRNEQVQVSMPGTNLASGGSTAPTSSTILPGGPPTSSPLPSSHT